MTKVGEQLSAIVGSSKDDEQINAVVRPSDEAMLDFSAQPAGLKHTNTAPTKNPYRCYCRPGEKCQIHLASSKLAEPRH
jgi:hypothetical protein